MDLLVRAAGGPILHWCKQGTPIHPFKEILKIHERPVVYATPGQYSLLP